MSAVETAPSSAGRRYARLWWQYLRQAVRRDLQFRAQALTTGVTAVADLVLSLVPVLIVVGFVGDRTGWTGPLAVAVVGVYGIACALIDCFVAPNMARMDAYVREGELDLVLIRPVNAFLYTALRWMQPAELTGVLTGAVLVVGGLLLSGVSVSIGGVLAALAWLCIGIVGFTLFWANASYLAFWMSAAEPVTEIVSMLRSAGQYPRAYFPRPARIVFTLVIPAGAVGGLPVEAVTGDVSAGWLPLAVLILAGAAALTVAHWRIAMRQYESASS